MFVIPPPSTKYYPQLAESIPKPVMDTHNVVERLSEEEYQLVVGEGTYKLRESLLVATPPPHPSETPSQPPNPLDTARKPPTAGTTLSLALVGPRGAALAQHLKQQLLLQTRPATPNSDESPESSHDAGSQNEMKSNSRSSDYNGSNNREIVSDLDDSLLSPPVFGQDNPALISTPGPKDSKDGLKKRKPKNSMVKTNSSFVSRVHPLDGLTKKLSERDPDGIFALANINRSFHWIDLSAIQKNKYAESYTKILFSKAHALCHDVNSSSTNSSHIDIIIGFSTGDMIWYEPISQKYTRINKNGMINPTAVFDIKWMPGSENLFLAAHNDGTLVVYDKEKDDASFVPDENQSQPSTPNHNRPTLRVRKSVRSQAQKQNPVAYWKVCNQRLNAVSFSPDGMNLAVVSADGRLRTIDFHNEILLDVYDSYFGELLCVCWSPDGNYILTGGQDDLISIWSFVERRLVARFQGHSAWVTSIAFDPWRCDERNYRFGSVGDDCRLLLWDFNVGMLHKPRTTSARQRTSVSSYSPGIHVHSDSMNARMHSETNISSTSLDGEEVIVHTAEPKSKIPMLRPLMEKNVDDHPLCWIGFQEDCIITSCRKGHIRIWDRPEENVTTGDEKP